MDGGRLMSDRDRRLKAVYGHLPPEADVWRCDPDNGDTLHVDGPTVHTLAQEVAALQTQIGDLHRAIRALTEQLDQAACR